MEACFQQNKKKIITATISLSCGICDNLQLRFKNYENFFL